MQMALNDKKTWSNLLIRKRQINDTEIQFLICQNDINPEV